MQSTRRTFLKTSAAVLSAPTALSSFLLRSARASVPEPAREGTVLVVLQLTGGNDGLNTVVPYENDVYARGRPTLRLRPEQVLKIGSDLGLHPDMSAFRALYDEGCVSIVQGVGYPNPEGGHGESMRNWLTADPHDTACQTGWLGRTVDTMTGDTSAAPALSPALFVGDIPQPLSMAGVGALIPSIRTAADFKLRLFPGTTGAGHLKALADLANAPRTTTGPLAERIRQTTVAAHETNRRVERTLAATTPSGTYPPYQLAKRLRTIAQLVRADVGIRIFQTELGGVEPGGFDNHANQAANHAALLKQFSESVAGFVADLKRNNLLDRVLLMTFSEFGRTVAENGRHGTGHGSAAPQFLIGGAVRGGLCGDHPSLTRLENGGPAFHTDFRRVYATALEKWLGVPSAPVLGGTYAPIDALKV